MTIKETLDAARASQQKILNDSRAAGRDTLTEDEQRAFDTQQAIIDTLSNVVNDERSAAAKAENTRVATITELGRAFGVDVSAYISDTTMTEDKARAAVLEELKKKKTPMPARAVQVEGEVDRFRAAASDALFLKAGGKLEKAADGAAELRGRSLRDFAREALIVDGSDARSVISMDDEALLRSFYNPASSFPAILDTAIRKSIVEAYKVIPTTFEKWVTKGSLSDFKQSKDREYVLGSFSEFKEVKENGEIEMDTIASDVLPTRQLKTYAKSFSLTRQAFIDDDIGFIVALPTKFTQSAKQTIEKQVYTVLYSNSKIFDGKTLFHADHANVISGAGSKPGQASIQAAILTGRKQKNQFGEPIFWNPKYLLVPVGYEFDLAVLFRSAQVVGSGNNDINPLYNYPLEVVQVPTLNALAGSGACPWFLASDPQTCKHIQVDYLNGQETPTLRRWEKPGELGFHWDVWLDWGVSVVDFRGLVKNAGAVIE